MAFFLSSSTKSFWFNQFILPWISRIRKGYEKGEHGRIGKGARSSFDETGAASFSPGVPFSPYLCYNAWDWREWDGGGESAVGVDRDTGVPGRELYAGGDRQRAGAELAAVRGDCGERRVARRRGNGAHCPFIRRSHSLYRKRERRRVHGAERGYSPNEGRIFFVAQP